MNVKIGVAIPVYNEESLILKTLISLLNQHGKIPKYFIVLADNGSTDGTKRNIQLFCKSNPRLPVYLVHEKKKGCRFARIKALDTAYQMGADYLLSTDADTLVPSDIISVVAKLLKDSPQRVIKGQIFFPPKTMLLQILYFKKIKLFNAKIRRLETKIFGSRFSGAYFALTTKLYQNIYLDDIDYTAIFYEDHLLSQRLYCLGARFFNSPNQVITSDRRFWADISLYAKGIRKKDYRDIQEIDNFRGFDETELKEIINYRALVTAERFLRQFVDALSFWQIDKEKHHKALLICHRVLKYFDIPDHSIQYIAPSQQYTFFQYLKQKYILKIHKRLHSYLNSYER